MPNTNDTQQQEITPLYKVYQEDQPVWVSFDANAYPTYPNQHGIIHRVETHALAIRFQNETILTFNEEEIQDGSVGVYVLSEDDDIPTALLPKRKWATTIKRIAKGIFSLLFAYAYLFGVYSITRYVTDSNATATIVMGILAVGTSVHTDE